MMSGPTVDVPKTLLVVLALAELGGEADLEHIAVRAHEMFPGQFCWRHFQNLPDKDAVRVHLSEAKKPSFGGLVTDRDLRRERRADTYVKRFSLTAAGLRRAEELRSASLVAKLKGRNSSLDYQRYVRPVVQSEGYRLYRSGSGWDAIGRDQFLMSFKLFADASPYVISGRIARTASAVVASQDSEADHVANYIRDGRVAFDV